MEISPDERMCKMIQDNKKRECSNCGDATHDDHPDICCLCFSIAFGEDDHDQEHCDAHNSSTITYARLHGLDNALVAGVL